MPQNGIYVALSENLQEIALFHEELDAYRYALDHRLDRVCHIAVGVNIFDVLREEAQNSYINSQ